MSKPPMPDPMHSEEYVELARMLERVEWENIQLKREIKWLLRADCIGPHTTKRLVDLYDLERVT